MFSNYNEFSFYVELAIQPCRVDDVNRDECIKANLLKVMSSKEVMLTFFSIFVKPIIEEEVMTEVTLNDLDAIGLENIEITRLKSAIRNNDMIVGIELFIHNLDLSSNAESNIFSGHVDGHIKEFKLKLKFVGNRSAITEVDIYPDISDTEIEFEISQTEKMSPLGNYLIIDF